MSITKKILVGFLVPLFVLWVFRGSIFTLFVPTIYSSKVKLAQAEELDAYKVILDTRSIDEFRISHIEGAQYLGFDDFESNFNPGIPKDEPILVYCSIGYRSEIIALKLKNMGYTRVLNLNGGIFGWLNKGNKLVNLDGTITENIHPYNNFWGFWLVKGNKVYP
jgi:rhodanese-related sulfurtransferase